jgi:hypothetical protein
VQRRGDVGEPQVDAADVEPGQRSGATAHVSHLGVHEVRDVLAGPAGGQVRVAAERDSLAVGRH